MAVTLFKKVDYPLDHLIQSIELGNIGLPDIQRPFVWDSAKVRDLLDSMYRGFPVGTLLFWSNEHMNGIRQIGTSQKQTKIPNLLIVDGQQRLTGLYAVLKGLPVLTKDYQETYIRIAFRPTDGQFQVANVALERSPEYIADISVLWANGGTSYSHVKRFLERLRQTRSVDDDEEQRISLSIDRLFDLRNYPFTALEIESTVSNEDVSDIFVRINSQGTELNIPDFILTLLSVFWDEGRKELETFARAARQVPVGNCPSPFNYFIQPAPDQLLRVSIAVGFKRARLEHVYSLLRGKDLETEQFSDERREQQFEILKEAQSKTLNLQNWHDFLNVLRAAGFRSGKMITSQTAVLYAYAMYLIGKYDYQIEPFVLRTLIARWFFMTSLTGRYTGSPETVMSQDLARLRGIDDATGFIEILNRMVEAELTNDFWNINVPASLETSSARTPALFAYYAALNLLGAHVLFSNMKVSDMLDPTIKGHRRSIERHHLFPRAYLKKQGYTETPQINQIANYALVEWGDNTSIKDRKPADYFPQYARRFPREQMQRMMFWHALPDRWFNMRYEDFLAQRRKLMAQVIRQGFETLKVPH